MRGDVVHVWLSALILLMSAGAAHAQMIAPLPQAPVAPAPQAAGPLALGDVLASSRRHAPQVLEAMAKLRAAEGKRLSVEGAFDTVFSAAADTRLSGYYDGRTLETTVKRPIEDFGGTLYGGYRVSRGDFPIYEDKSFTNRAGEIKAGAVLSLLRDRMIDERRFNRTLADGDVALADAERLMVAIGVQARALDAYNAWAVAGLRLAVYRDLLKLAEDRQDGLRRQVATGFRPAIILTENEQNILRRRTLVVQAEQTLAQAANALSLFWRDAAGRPVRPLPSQLPNALPSPVPLPADPRSALVQRPDFRTVELRINLARQRLALDRNALLPRLEFAAEASRDLGEVGLGGVSRSGTETRVGLTFTVPLQQRQARGRLAQTEAEIEAFARRGQALGEQITAEIDGIGIAVDASARLLTISSDEKDRALAMAAAERRRFEMGASDFFLLNLREEAAADAEVRYLDSAYRQIVAHADMAAVTANTEVLGL